MPPGIRSSLTRSTSGVGRLEVQGYWPAWHPCRAKIILVHDGGNSEYPGAWVVAGQKRCSTTDALLLWQRWWGVQTGRVQMTLFATWCQQLGVEITGATCVPLYSPERCRA
jgi:hypothetical protein